MLAGTGGRLWLEFAPQYLQTLGAVVLRLGLFEARPTFPGASLCGALGAAWFGSFDFRAAAVARAHLDPATFYYLAPVKRGR